MDPKIWRDKILEIIRDIADADFQRKVWFGLVPGEISSPSELYSLLFDDLLFEKFLSTKQDSLNSVQLSRLLELKRLLDEFRPDEAHLDPLSVIDDPQWEIVRRSAKEVLNSFAKTSP